jgi:hypothetical protein
MASTSSTSVSVASNSAFEQGALGFFTGVRLPASLVAGSSVAAVFSLTQQAKDTSGLTRTEIAVLRIYHVVTILSLCMSMTTVSTTTTASTLLLLKKRYHRTESSYADVYHFLKGELNFEFVLTRWTFLSSIVLFLVGVASRLLLELNLLKPGRRTEGLLVGCTMAGVITGIIANINEGLNCWPNLIAMTGEVLQLVWERTTKSRGPMQLISLVSFVVAAGCVVKCLVCDDSKR